MALKERNMLYATHKGESLEVMKIIKSKPIGVGQIHQYQKWRKVVLRINTNYKGSVDKFVHSKIMFPFMKTYTKR